MNLLKGPWVYRALLLVTPCILLASVVLYAVDQAPLGNTALAVAATLGIALIHAQTRTLIAAVEQRTVRISSAVRAAREEAARSFAELAESQTRLAADVEKHHTGICDRLSIAAAAQDARLAGELGILADAVERSETLVRDLPESVESRVASRVDLERLSRGIRDLARGAVASEAVLISEIDAVAQLLRGAVATSKSDVLRATAEVDARLARLEASTSAAAEEGQRNLNIRTASILRFHNKVAEEIGAVQRRLREVEARLGRADASARTTQAGIERLENLTREAAQRDVSAEARLEAAGRALDVLHEESRAHGEAVAAVQLAVQQYSDKAQVAATLLRETRRAAHDSVELLRERIDEAGSGSAREMSELRTSATAVITRLESYAEAIARGLDNLGEIDQRLSSVQDRVGGLHRSMAEGFRATRVSIEQAPQIVDQYHAMRELLAAQSLALPPTGGWAMTVAAISEVVSRVLAAEREPVVIELGSGVSTVWLSLALRQRGNGRLISLEHDEEFLEQTRRLLDEHGAPSYVDLVLAPLVTVDVDGCGYEWYDTSKLPINGAADMLIVDGPPGADSPRARYPALPVLAPLLRAGSLILVDDTIRVAERDMIEEWRQKYPHLEVERRLDKATLLRWGSADGNSSR